MGSKNHVKGLQFSGNKNYLIRSIGKYNKSLEISEKKILRGDYCPLYYVSELSSEKENFIEELRGKIGENCTVEKVLETIDALNIEEKEKKSFAKVAVDYLLGFGVIQPLLDDDDIEEIMVVGVDEPVYIYHRNQGMCETNISFKDPSVIECIIDKIAKINKRTVDSSHPLLDGRLPDGSRVNATLSNVSLAGPTITIRKFMSDPLTIVDLIKVGTLDSKVAAFLWLVVESLGKKAGNILISGGTGSGKTTLLNCLAIFIPARERVITIEDTIELQIPVKHKIALETRPPYTEGGEITADMMLKNALRMRPDRIIINEVRGDETKTLFTAMNTGHDGCMSTIHANSAKDTLTRLTNPPMNVITLMIPSLDLIIIQNRFHEGNRAIRRVTEIAEVSGIEGEKVLLNNVYRWDQKTDTLKETGTPSVLKQKIANYSGFSGKMLITELETRELLLEYMVSKNITKQESVYRWIQEYYMNPDMVLDKISKKKPEF